MYLGELQVLLLLYEFEALVMLFDPRAESVLERALVIPNSEPRIFESLAGKQKLLLNIKYVYKILFSILHTIKHSCQINMTLHIIKFYI